MKTKKSHALIAALGIAILGMGLYGFRYVSSLAQRIAPEGGYQYYTIYSQDAQVLLQTGLPVQAGDQFISPDNTRYRVNRLAGAKAWAEAITSGQTRQARLVAGPTAEMNAAAYPRSNQADGVPHVVIYHTHTDESYALSSTAASEPGQGDIMAVGAQLTAQLQANGISATHDATLHDPHDVHAYHRSRKTLLQLLKEQPDAAFDLHRDSAPTEAYVSYNNGLLYSRVMIVIGRSNPHAAANLDYAERLKAAADAIYPGLIRGIYMGKGAYNQDLYPTALLFEIGTENMSRDLADKASTCLADVLQIFLNS
jgi:stage II sporulation protein P